MTKAKLDTALISRMTGGLWHDNSEKSEPVKEKSASISFYRQVPEHEERGNKDISEPVAKLKKFIEEYYVEINPNTGKPQTFEEYIFELIADAKNGLRHGIKLGDDYIKEVNLEFLDELESYLVTWQKLKTQPSSQTAIKGIY